MGKGCRRFIVGIGGGATNDDSVDMGISRHMKLIPCEVLVGLTSTIAAVVIYVIAG